MSDISSDNNQQPIPMQVLGHVAPFTSGQTSSNEGREPYIKHNVHIDASEYDTQAHSPDIKTSNIIADTSLSTNLQQGKFDNEKWSPCKIAADALAILLPLGLLAFMIAVTQLDSKEVDQPTFLKWTNSINVFATIFPILFASIIGRLSYEVARWKLELGSTMGVLEQLLGSRSVGSVVITHFQLRAFNMLGLSLLFIWAFSPLGSQSILRTLTSRLEARVSTSTVVNFENLHESGLARYVVASPNAQEISDSFFQYLKVLFSATLMTSGSVKVGSMDQWGNVKIPFLPTTKTNAQEVDSEWQELGFADSLERYSAVAGIPVANIPFGNTTFFLESTYVELDCHNVSKTSWKPDLPSLKIDVQWNWTTIPANGTWQGITDSNFNRTYGGSPSWNIALNNFVDDYWVNQTTQGEMRAPGEQWSDPKNPKRIWHIFDNSPERFTEQSGIQVNPTELLFQAEMSTDMHSIPDTVTAFCEKLHGDSSTTIQKTSYHDAMEDPFHVLFCYDHDHFSRVDVPKSDPWSWIEAEVRIKDEPGIIPVLKQENQTARSVKFAKADVENAVTAALEPQRDLQPIQDLCAAISTLMQPDRDVCFSLLAQEIAKQKYGVHIYPAKHLSQDIDTWSLSPLRDILKSPDFARQDRLKLAVTLASSCLQLHETPWLETSWGKDNIFFIERPGEILYDQPFVSNRNCPISPKRDAPSSMSRIIRNQTLYALGVALIELWYGRSLSELHRKIDGELGTGNVQIDLMTEWNIADRVVDDLYSDAGGKYSDAVRRCIRCDFDRRANSLEDAQFQKAVYEGVVTQLKENYEFLYQ